MNGSNFNWFLHVMLFMHALFVLQKQEEKRLRMEDGDESDTEDEKEDESDFEDDNDV
jgi:hypothetical protein